MRKSNRIEETQPVSSHNQAQPLHHRRLKWLIATQHAIPCFHAVPAVLWGSLEDLSMSLSANRLDCMLDAGNKQSNEREDLGMHGWQGRAD